MKRIAHQTLGAIKHAVEAGAGWEFQPGERVLADGLPGVVDSVDDTNPYGIESYTVTLDNGVGGGEYTAAQLQRPAAVTASLVDQQAVSEGLGAVEAGTQHTADFWYPELGTILTDRLPNERIEVTAGLRRVSSTHAEWGGDNASPCPWCTLHWPNRSANHTLRECPESLNCDGCHNVVSQDEITSTADGRYLCSNCASTHTANLRRTARLDDDDEYDFGYEHGLVRVPGNKPLFEKYRDQGRNNPSHDAYLNGHAAGTAEADRRDQERAQKGLYRCPECRGSGIGPWKSSCKPCEGSGSIGADEAHRTDTLYHITDNPHFAPRADHIPQDNAVAIEQRSAPGLYAAHDYHVGTWANQHDYVRPYVAELHVPRMAHEPGRWGGERFIPAQNLDQVRVSRVIPFEAHQKEVWDNKPYRGRDARDMTPEQHARHKERALNILRGRGFEPEDIEHLRRTWASRTASGVLPDDGVERGEDLDVPDVCSFCGNPGPWTDEQDTGRGIRIRCATCGGTMRRNFDDVAGTSSIQWQPEFPNSPQNAASRAGDPRATINDLRVVHSQLNAVATEQAGYAIFIAPELRAQLDQQLRATAASLNGVADEDFVFTFTATWADVRKKATRIRKEGGVRILAANASGVVGEVQGDTALYESAFNYVPGTKKIADWACGCKWAAYAWGRSPAYQRFEGRRCSHVLALQFEAQSRGMFGQQVTPDQDRLEGQHQRTPVQVQYERPSAKYPDGRDIRRRSVPPGNMRRTFSALAYQYADVPPTYEWARLFTALGTPPSEVLHAMHALGVPHAAARAAIDWATGSDASATVLTDDGTAHRAVAVTGGLVHTASGVQLPTDAVRLVLAANTDDEATADPDGGQGDPGTDIPGIDTRNQTDRKKKPNHLLHHTNDARSHAPDWGYGVPWGGAYLWCDQCNGSGCGHCGGTGQVLVPQDGSPAPSEASTTNSPVADQNADAGPMIGEGGGLSSVGSVHTAADRGFSEHNHFLERLDKGPEDEPYLAGRREEYARDITTHTGHNYTLMTGAPTGFGSDTVVTAHRRLSNGKYQGVGYLSWFGGKPQYDGSNIDGGVIYKAHVSEQHRRRGIASAMLDFARERYPEMDVRHSTALSEDGKAWSQAHASLHTADYSVNDFGAGNPAQTYQQLTPHANTANPASTGWAASADPKGWVNPIINSSFGRWESMLHHGFVMTAAGDTSKPPTHAGVALKAADTGRVLMIQRSNKDESDPARGTWEFPGGGREDGDLTSLHTGIREWEEEVGHTFPEGGHVTHVHRSGPYVLHTVVIPEEGQVDFSGGRSTVNPDDPDGDDHEQSAWWDPEHARKNPALRPECKSSPWSTIQKAAEWNYTPQDMDSGPDDGPIVHTPGQVPPRRLRPGDSLLWDDGTVHHINAASYKLLHVSHPDGRFPRTLHRAPIEGDNSGVITSEGAREDHPQHARKFFDLGYMHGLGSQHDVYDRHRESADELGIRPSTPSAAYMDGHQTGQLDALDFQHPDANWLLDQQEQGPSKYSTRIRQTSPVQDGPLPMENGTYYRLHHPSRPFSREHATTRNIGEAPHPDLDQYWDPKPGYSGFWNPHHLDQYLEHMGWDRGESGSKVIRFQGTPVGEGADGEPRVMPHGDHPDEVMSVKRFRDRLDITPNGYGRWDEHTWGDGPHGQQVDDGYRTVHQLFHDSTLHDSPEGALPSTDGSADEDDIALALGYGGLPRTAELDVDDDQETDNESVEDADAVPQPVPGLPLQRSVPWGYPESAADHPDPLVAQPGSADLDMEDPDQGALLRTESSVAVPPELAQTAAANPAVAGFMQTAGFRALMTDAAPGGGGAGVAVDGVPNDADIAAAAREALSKTSAKNFSFAEQQELIAEGGGKARARNFADLRVEGTHYAHIKDDDPTLEDDFFLL